MNENAQKNKGASKREKGVEDKETLRSPNAYQKLKAKRTLTHLSFCR